MTPRTVADLVGYRGELRAGGTDVEARRPLGLIREPVIDLAGIDGLAGVEALDGGGWRIGTMARLATLAGHVGLAGSHPAVAEAAGQCGPPPIRAVATVGGNMLQHTRCPYLRTGRVHCHRTGGDGCPARNGDLRFGVVFDLGPCPSPHPSTLAVALMAHDAVVVVEPGGRRSIRGVYGDGSEPAPGRLAPGSVLTAVEIPPPWTDEVAVHHRTTIRNTPEWPVVEVTVRLGLTGDTVRAAAVAVGGIAPVPIRLPAVEEALVGSSRPVPAGDFRPLLGEPSLAQTGFKLDVLAGTLEGALARLMVGDLWRPVTTGALS